MSSRQSLVHAFNSLRKRDGDYLALLKALYFESLKDKYPAKKISDLLLESKGGSWGNEKFENGIRAKVLRSPDIRFGFIDFEKAEERFFTNKEIENFKLRENDILVIKSNGSLDLVGKSQILKSNPAFPNVVASNFLLVLRPNEQKVYAEYLDLFLKSPQALVWRFEEQKTTTGLRNLNTKGYLSLELPIPADTKEQKRLFDNFQRYTNGSFQAGDDYYQKVFIVSNAKESLSAELDHQLALVKELRQAYLREAMQGKLVAQDERDEPAGILLEKIKAEKERLIAEKKIKRDKHLPPINAEEVPFEIPSNWTWCRLGEISTNVEYGTSEKGDLNSKDIAVLRMNNIQSGKVILENLKYVKATIEDLPRLYLKNNDLLFNRTNSYELVGKAGVFKGESDEITFASYLIRVQFSDFVSVDFANYYINSIQCRETQIEPDIIQQNGQANFNGTKLKNIIVPLPPLAEQKRIVAKLEKLIKSCDELEANIRHARANADQLLQTALKEALEAKS